MHELNASNCRSGRSEAFQAEPGAQPEFHIAMVLFDEIIQVFRRAKLRQLGKLSLLLKFAAGAVRGCIAIQCNGFGCPTLNMCRYAKEGLG